MAGGATAPRSLPADHARVKRARRVARSRRTRAELDRFVIEGPVLVAEAVAAGVEIDYVLVPETTHPRLPDQVEVFAVAERVFESISTTVTPQGAMAVATRPRHRVPIGEGLVLVLAGVADPGNAGTLIRAAEAAGAAGVVLAVPAVDAFGPKAVRASAGSVFRLPVEEVDRAALSELVVRDGLEVWGTTAADGGRSYDDVDLTGAPLVVLGNESHGIADARSIDRWLSIPMAGGPQSLNVAMAGTVVLFEAQRQRRRRPDR